MEGRSLNGSGCGSGEWLGWQEEEGGTGVILPPTFSPDRCYEPRLKGTPLLSARNTSWD
jgi:hypothetical protein